MNMDIDEPLPKQSPSVKHSRKAKSKKATPPHLAHMNPSYQAQDFKDVIENSFKQSKEIKHDNGGQLYVDPFKVCTLPNFIKDPKFLEGLRDELLDQIFHEKNNDLYKFQQSDDLKKISSPYIKTLRKMFQEEVSDWMQEVTGITLNNKVALTCSRYDYTDVLLCHDDELDTRRIAFILYLVPPWKPEDGGALDLFDMDEHLQPNQVVRSLFPSWNMFSWFEVTEASHHQVAEVLSQDKTRLSVNGWFHGRTEPRPDRYVEPKRSLLPYRALEEEQFYDWINPIYLDPEVQGQIQEKFENDSEIELQGFLKEDKYNAVMEALEDEKICWCHRKPANKRSYHGADVDSVPDIISQCLTFLQSEPMFLTLSNLTGLSLHELAPQDSDTESTGGEKAGGSGGGNGGVGHRKGAVNDEDDDDEDGECGTSENVTRMEDRTIDTIQEEVEESEEEEQEEGTESGKGDKEEEEEEEEDMDTKLQTPKKRRKLNSECRDKENGDANEEDKACSTPRCRAEVRRWQQGDYTLVHDTDAEASDYALDAMLFCGCKDWTLDYGGYTAYIAKGEDEELLTVLPAENSLALVYRDKDTLRFVKHINDRMKENTDKFYDFSVVYYE